MTDQHLLAEFDALEFDEKMILALLALIGEPIGRAMILDHLRKAEINDSKNVRYKVETLDDTLRKLDRLAFISTITGRGLICNVKLRWPAIRAAIGAHMLDELADAHDFVVPMRQTWNSVEPRSYRAGVARLRMALLRGLQRKYVAPLLQFCEASYESAQLHPLIDIFGRPFEAGMVARVHPELQDEVLARLLANAQREPATATALREFCEQFFERRMEEDSYVSSELRLALTEQAMLCGRLDDATRYLQLAEGPLKQFYEAAIAALRGEQAGAIVAFEAALKALRRESGKRKQLFEGMGGHLYILALLRSGDSKHLKSAETYLDSELRAPHNHDTAVYQQLNLLRQIRAGTLQADGGAWPRMGGAPAGADVPVAVVLLTVAAGVERARRRIAGAGAARRTGRIPADRRTGRRAARPSGRRGAVTPRRRAAGAPGLCRHDAVVRAPGSMAAPAHGADQSSTSCAGRRHRRDAAGLDAGLRCPPRPDRRRAARTKT